MQWYVINTKPGKENMVSKLLEQASIEALNPKIKTDTARIKPLFPNYIFVNWDLEAAERYHMIKYTRGVNKVLGTRSRPVPIASDVIDIIKSRLNSVDVLEQNNFKKGARVKVKNGLLKDLIGVLEKPVSPQGRVAVLLEMYERQLKAVLPVRDVALVA